MISYDKYRQGYADGNTRETSLAEIFSESDIVSLHVPLTEETKYMVDNDFMQRFRKNIWLINTSRGPILKTADLEKNIRSGKIIGVALDVLEFEDASFENIAGKWPGELDFLLKSDKVILSPHIAGWTHESHIKLSRVLVEKIRKIL